MQVFFSYSRKDWSFVDRLAHDVEARGHHAWIDTEDLAGAGEDRWRRSIVQGIRGSSALVLVLSPDSVQSPQVERELNVAAEIKRRIVPVVHRPCDLPDGFQFELAGVQRIDFATEPYERALDDLVHRLDAIDRTAAMGALGADREAAAPRQSDSDQPGKVAARPAPTADLPAPTTSAVLPVTPETPETPVMPAANVTPLRDLLAAPPVAAARPAVAKAVLPVEGPRRSTADRRVRRVAAAVAGAMLVLGSAAGVGIAASQGSEGSSSTSTTADPGSTIAGSTTAASTSPSTTDGHHTTTTSPSTSTTTTSTTVATTPEQAKQPVLDLATAYTKRDWDAVRRINTNQSGLGDAKFEQVYGKAGGIPRLEEDHHVITGLERVDPSRWTVIGAIVAWDYLEGPAKSTNVACVRWDVDAEQGTAPATGVKNKLGKGNQRIDGWVPASEFAATVAKLCR